MSGAQRAAPPRRTRYTCTVVYTHTLHHRVVRVYIGSSRESRRLRRETFGPSLAEKRDAPALAHRSVRSGVRVPIPPVWFL